MLTLILSILTLLANGLLLLFTLRRWLFLWVAYRAAVPVYAPFTPLPSILLLVPFHNEAENLRQLLPCLAQLDYPARQLQGVLIDDGSTDESGRFCQSWIAMRNGWHLLQLPHNRGKAVALNAALAAFAHGDFVAVYDADERPFPDVLQQLVRPFTAPDIVAVSGRRRVQNPTASPIASYATYENLVHQLITVSAKDRLRLHPPILGSNCLYRRAALTAVNGFQPGTLLEDSDLTLKFARKGVQTTYQPAAVSEHAVPVTVADYWRQHTRWTAGFQEVASKQSLALLTATELTWWQRLELLLFASGYLDRIALLLALVLMPVRSLPALRPLLALYLATPFVQISVVLRRSGSTWLLWRRMIWLPFLFLLDLLATAVTQLQRRTNLHKSK